MLMIRHFKLHRYGCDLNQRSCRIRRHTQSKLQALKNSAVFKILYKYLNRDRKYIIMQTNFNHLYLPFFQSTTRRGPSSMLPTRGRGIAQCRLQPPSHPPAALTAVYIWQQARHGLRWDGQLWWI